MPLPSYMLCLQDPADETNDLGRKAATIKHAQATFLDIHAMLLKDIEENTCASILSPLVGSSYLMDKPTRDKLDLYYRRLMARQKQREEKKMAQATVAEDVEDVRDVRDVGKTDN